VSVTDDYRAVVGHLRSWGFDVREESGCYGRSNGIGWNYGVPVGHINHHYVCSLNPDQGYIDQLVASLKNGTVVNWFADVNGRAYLIGTGPMNHSGTGNSSVLSKTRADQPPPHNPASSAGDMTGNAYYSGTEGQHPGDDTPWPQPLLDVMVAINAAEALVWGWTANRAIHHSEWSNRKIDMSAGGGPSDWSGAELRRRVAARMTGEDEDMPTADEVREIIRDELHQFFSVDKVTMDGDEMSEPPTYSTTRDGISERTARLASIASARVSGRDGKHAITDARAVWSGEKFIVSNDRASTPNDVAYNPETWAERILRLVSGTFVGESGTPHNDPQAAEEEVAP
jgi:hypothetical protein